MQEKTPDPDDPTAKQAQTATTPGLRATCRLLSQDSVQSSLTAQWGTPTSAASFLPRHLFQWQLKTGELSQTPLCFSSIDSLQLVSTQFKQPCKKKRLTPHAQKDQVSMLAHQCLLQKVCSIYIYILLFRLWLLITLVKFLTVQQVQEWQFQCH